MNRATPDIMSTRRVRYFSGVVMDLSVAVIICTDKAEIPHGSSDFVFNAELQFSWDQTSTMLGKCSSGLQLSS